MLAHVAVVCLCNCSMTAYTNKLIRATWIILYVVQ